jgi:signal peptidase II
VVSEVQSGRGTVEVTADGEQGVPVNDDGSTVPGDGVSAQVQDGPETSETSGIAEAVGGVEPAGAADGDAGKFQTIHDPTDSAIPEPAPESVAVAARRRTISILLAVAALALLLDAVSKLIVVATLSHRAPVRLPGGFLYLTLWRNPGAAFSIGESRTWLFTLIAAAVVVVILRVSRRLRSVPWACALGLLLAGALGNLGDRVFRSPGLFRGHVVDFLQFPTFPIVHYDFPIFNLADSSIVGGGCVMVLLSFLGMQPDGTRHQPEQKDA